MCMTRDFVRKSLTSKTSQHSSFETYYFQSDHKNSNISLDQIKTKENNKKEATKPIVPQAQKVSS